MSPLSRHRSITLDPVEPRGSSNPTLTALFFNRLRHISVENTKWTLSYTKPCWALSLLIGDYRCFRQRFRWLRVDWIRALHGVTLSLNVTRVYEALATRSSIHILYNCMWKSAWLSLSLHDDILPFFRMERWWRDEPCGSDTTPSGWFPFHPETINHPQVLYIIVLCIDDVTIE